MFFRDASRVLRINPELPATSPDSFKGASIDSRTLEPGNLFIALGGTKADGHIYLPRAFEKGAAGAIISKTYWENHSGSPDFSAYRNLFPVSDPAAAFASLAAEHRSQLRLQIGAVTGSVGKTSTKEFLRFLLQQKFSVAASEGNFNNHLGLPLTLFRMTQEHERGAVELGANHPGDIRMLASILRPDLGVITRIAPCHLEGFGSLAAIYEAKLELFDSLRPGSTAILPDDDSILIEKANRFRLRFLKVGMSQHADYRISGVRAEKGKIFFRVNAKREYNFPGFAAFLVSNAAMAIAAAESMGIEPEDIPEDWSDIKMPAGRFQEQAIAGGIRAIFDGYNASPASFDAAIETFSALPAENRRVLVFADMLELGPDEKKYHEALGKKIAASGIHYVIGYGERARYTVQALEAENPSLRSEWFQDSLAAAQELAAEMRPGDIILFKASRGMRVEDVLKFVREKSGSPLVS